MLCAFSVAFFDTKVFFKNRFWTFFFCPFSIFRQKFFHKKCKKIVFFKNNVKTTFVFYKKKVLKNVFFTLFDSDDWKIFPRWVAPCWLHMITIIATVGCILLRLRMKNTRKNTQHNLHSVCVCVFPRLDGFMNKLF